MSRLSKDLMTSDEVYEMMDNGLDIWKHEIEDFSICRNVKNPFIVDKNPSCRIKQSRKSGIWLLNIYNSEGGFYTPISFIQEKYGLNYPQAIEYILGEYKSVEAKQIENNVKTTIKSTISYDFQPIPYTEKHLNYFRQGCLNEEFLTKEMDIYACGKYAINKNIKYPKNNEIMFTYEYRDITGKPTGKLKFLTIGKTVEKKDKWRNNIDPTNFFYTYKIKDGDTVFIVKSNKDAAITACFGITSIATLSENKVNISEGLKKLMPLFPNCEWVLNLGSDEQGFKTSYDLSKEFNISWFNIPKKFLLNGINDNFSFVQYFSMGEFKKLLFKKGYL